MWIVYDILGNDHEQRAESVEELVKEQHKCSDSACNEHHKGVQIVCLGSEDQVCDSSGYGNDRIYTAQFEQELFDLFAHQFIPFIFKRYSLKLFL